MEEDVLERAKKKMVLEYASMSSAPLIHFFWAFLTYCDHCAVVINQMDTSQAHLSSKGPTNGKDTSKPDNLSRDELTAVLKYGAQKMLVDTLFFHLPCFCHRGDEW